MNHTDPKCHPCGTYVLVTECQAFHWGLCVYLSNSWDGLVRWLLSPSPGPVRKAKARETSLHTQPSTARGGPQIETQTADSRNQELTHNAHGSHTVSRGTPQSHWEVEPTAGAFDFRGKHRDISDTA